MIRFFVVVDRNELQVKCVHIRNNEARRIIHLALRRMRKKMVSCTLNSSAFQSRVGAYFEGRVCKKKTTPHQCAVVWTRRPCVVILKLWSHKGVAPPRCRCTRWGCHRNVRARLCEKRKARSLKKSDHFLWLGYLYKGIVKPLGGVFGMGGAEQGPGWIGQQIMETASCDVTCVQIS